MTRDQTDELALVREHLRGLDPPSASKNRVAFKLEERLLAPRGWLAGRWAVGLGVVLLAGVGLAASGGSWWGGNRETSTETVAVRPPPRAPALSQRAAPRASQAPPEPAPLMTEPEQRARPAPRPRAAQSTPRSQQQPADDHTLALQVAELQAAIAFAKRDDQRALRQLRAFKQRWPKSSLTHEADIEIVAALRRLGRDRESRAAAKDFVHSHPGSAKTREMRALAEESVQP